MPNTMAGPMNSAKSCGPPPSVKTGSPIGEWNHLVGPPGGNANPAGNGHTSGTNAGRLAGEPPPPTPLALPLPLCLMHHDLGASDANQPIEGAGVRNSNGLDNRRR